MTVQDAHVSALQEAVILTKTLGRHAKDPIMIAYYRFLSDNLNGLLHSFKGHHEIPNKTFQDNFLEPSVN